jgi:hypothetical protein
MTEKQPRLCLDYIKIWGKDAVPTVWEKRELGKSCYIRICSGSSNDVTKNSLLICSTVSLASVSYSRDQKKSPKFFMSPPRTGIVHNIYDPLSGKCGSEQGLRERERKGKVF